MVTAFIGPLQLASPADAITLPSGFQEQVVFSGLSQPTNIEFAPDGRIFVAEKGGRIKVFDDLADTTPTIFADLSSRVHNQWDRGLLGLALAPNFPASPWVYVLYTYDAPPGQTAPVWNDVCANSNNGLCVVTGQLSRLQANGNVMTGSEQPLIRDWCQQYPSHSIGDIAFGADGMLYVTGGDGASFSAVDYGNLPAGSPTNPCTDPVNEGGALRSQDLRTTGDETQLDGTLLRLDPATGAAAPGNPLIGSSDLDARRIVATGLRNPFRLTMRPGTNEAWISDTGWNAWEEVDRVIDPTAGVANFGWPCYEGNNRNGGYEGVGLPICTGLYSEGAGAHTQPFVAWNHSSKLVPGEACPTGSSSSTGVAFYPTSGGPYPAAYHGAVFFADYSRNCIWAALPAAPGGLPSSSNVITFGSAASSPVDLEVGPGGELYYVDLNGGAIRRIRYFPGNQPPDAVIDATPTQGPAPLTVSFNATGSNDPDPADDGRLTYAWDFTNDGTTDSTSATASFTYNATGTYTAKLTVTDTLGASDTATVTITPGNQAPTAIMTTPVVGTTWKVGDTISFSGNATDPQQGNLPASALAWHLRMQHCSEGGSCHTHAIQDFTGVASGSFVAPDHEYPSYLELELVATDQQGLTHSVVRRLDPLTVSLTFASNPSGLQLTVGSSAAATPFSRTVIQGSANSISAPTPQTSAGTSYNFGAWSDGGAQSHVITAPTTPTTYTATYTPAAPATFGNTSVGAQTDSGDMNFMNGSRFVTGSSPITINSMSVYVRAVQASPNNQFQLAIYTDSAGSPAARVASSASGSLTANSWNSRPVSATLAANTAYWLMYNTNGNNNMAFTAGAAGQGAWSNNSVTFGTWPATFGASTKSNYLFSLYATAGADTTLPTVTATVPGAGATDVAVSTPVTVQFSEPMAAATITSANLELRTGGNLVNRTVTYDGANNRATITPAAALTASTVYTVTVKGGASGVGDVAGNRLAADHTFSFTTGTVSSGQILGYDQIGALLDAGDMNFMNGSRFVTGSATMSVTQAFVYMRSVQAGPANQYQIAIYSDVAGSPGALVASSASGTLTANSWNSIALPATLSPNTAYWLMYNTNGNNNLSYDTASAGSGSWSVAARPFGTWPASFGSSVLSNFKISIYVR
jgi:glucose/arabinose dehydrogenase/PKD repeat protein